MTVLVPVACPAPDESSRPGGDRAARVSIGRVEVTYLAPGQPPRIAVAGRTLLSEDTLPDQDKKPFALAAGPDSILVSDREEGPAILVPRDGESARRNPLYVASPDLRRAGHFRVSMHGAPPATGAGGALYVAQAFGHTTGWVPAVYGALARLPEPVAFTAAIQRPEDATHARRKAEDPAGLRVVPLRYSDSESATITSADCANPGWPELLNREAALLWIADNLELAQVSASAAVIVNDCRPETWILHQLAEHGRRQVPLHAVRYAFEEFPWLRRIASQTRPSSHASGVAQILAASAPAIHTRSQLREALHVSGADPRRTPSVDFETASREITARVPGTGTIWYQAINWRDLLSLETGHRPYVVIPPLGQASVLDTQQAAARAGAVLAQRHPALKSLFTPRDPRRVALVAQGNGFSAHSRQHWHAILELTTRMRDTHFLFAGGTVRDRAWLERELAHQPRPNVTPLGWVDEHWSTFLRALRAKPGAIFVCRPGLSSIGAALANGVPPLLMSPDPLLRPDATVDTITAEVAMERAVYAFELERLYTSWCAQHPGPPLPVLLDTLADDQRPALATLRHAMRPDVHARQQAAIDEYCAWSRVAHLVASVLAREAAAGAMPIELKRLIRDRELTVRSEPPGVRDRYAPSSEHTRGTDT